MAKVQIVFGSVMGTAEGVAKTAEMILQGFGHETVLHQPFDKNLFDAEAATLVCTSSTGMGDLPENIVPFYQFLTSEPPKIHGRRYGVISLGDSSYPNFAQAGETIDAALADLGAERLGEVCIMDATEVGDHEEEIVDWLTAWQQDL